MELRLPCKEFVHPRLSLGLFSLLLLLATGCSGAPNDGSTAITLATPFADPARDKEVAEIYLAAKEKNGAYLLQLHDAAAQAHKPLDPAVTLGLYVLEPAAHVTDFLAGYPTTTVGVQLDYGTRLDRANLVRDGYVFPIAKLGDLAAKGNPDALTKLLAAFSVSGSGPTATRYGEEIAHVGAVVPGQMLADIAALPPAQQLDIAAIPAWCLHRPNILTVAAAGAAQAKVQEAIRQRLAECPRPTQAKPKHRRPARPHKPTGKHPPKHKPAPKHKAAEK